MERERVDFHAHYDPLDKNSPRRVIDLAKKSNVVGLGLLARGEIATDFNAAVIYGKECGVNVVPGIEILARIKNLNSHAELIGLGFNPNHEDLINHFGVEQQKNKNARVAMLQKQFIENLGLSVDVSSLEDKTLLEKIMNGETLEKAIHFCRFVCHLPNNRLIINKNKDDNSELWNRIKQECAKKNGYRGHPVKIEAKFLYELFFAVGMPGNNFVSKTMGSDLLRTSEDIIQTIHRAGGCVLYSPEGKYLKDIWDKLQQEDIDGLMVFHGGQLGIDKGKVDIPIDTIKEARANGLLTLGGSDYQNKDWRLGIGSGDLFISPRRLDELNRKLAEVRIRNKTA